MFPSTPSIRTGRWTTSGAIQGVRYGMPPSAGARAGPDPRTVIGDNRVIGRVSCAGRTPVPVCGRRLLFASGRAPAQEERAWALRPGCDGLYPAAAETLAQGPLGRVERRL